MRNNCRVLLKLWNTFSCSTLRKLTDYYFAHVTLCQEKLGECFSLTEYESSYWCFTRLVGLMKIT